ncbi:cyclin-dependent kinase 12 [Durio zibethinus]|uniref:Cyclin-dependent kinase 12 n=1 Tax=Durio zibethinus TaxID=66656 RepID=A0A6P5XI03_DURZI|nr:cyclin-dependent kinase 12 [Durio zibethinus]
MRGMEISWFPLILLLGSTVNNLSEASHDHKLHSAVVVGTVYCDTCFQEDFSKPTHFISGASVAVECKDGSSRPSFRQEVKTNERGEFKVHLPFSVSKHVKKIKRCSVELINSSEPYCAVASTATSSSLYLKSRKQGTHIFSAGFFTFKPLKQPNLCNQKPSVQDSRQINTQNTLRFAQPNYPTFPPPLQDPATPQPSPLLPNLPPLPQLPQLPPLPSLPGLPFPPIPGRN